MRVGLFRCCILLLVAAELRAQVIQLPSFSSVGVNTTVVVPDSGGAFVARDRRAAYGGSSFGGMPRNRGWGITRQAAGIGLTAQIHDPHAADDALAGKLVRRPPSGHLVPSLPAAAGTAANDSPPASVAELTRRRAAQAAEADREALKLVAKGRQAQAAGKPAVAAIYFKAAARQASGALRQQIAAELSALDASGPSRAKTARAAPK
jgi:hypothetical protein